MKISAYICIFLPFLLISIQTQAIFLTNLGCKQMKNNVCTECSQGYFLYQGSCQLVNPQCKTYRSNDGACTSCYQGYRIVENTCLPDSAFGSSNLNPNCHKFNKSTCVECSKGYYFNKNGICQPSDPSCKSFNSSNGMCLSCYNGFQLINGRCIQSEINKNCKTISNGVCIACSDGFYFNSQNICTKIDQQCKTFNYQNKICSQCFQGYKLNSFTNNCEIYSQNKNSDSLCKRYQKGKCVECANRSYFNNNNVCVGVDPICKDFNFNSKFCLSCFDGYALNGQNKCQLTLNKNGDPFCKKFQNGQCLECSYRYYRQNNGICALISPLCKQFSSRNGSCTACYLGFKLNNGACIEQTTSIYTDNLCAEWNNFGVCLRCSQRAYFGPNNICRKVSDLCDNYNSQNGLCTTCFNGYILNQGVCIKNPIDNLCKKIQNGVCKECAERAYFNSFGVCVQTDPKCKIFNSNNQMCTGCYEGYQLQAGICKLKVVSIYNNSNIYCLSFNQQGICVNCVNRYFLKNGDCIKVNDLCKSYQMNTGRCTSCYFDFALKNGGCVVYQSVSSTNINQQDNLNANAIPRSNTNTKIQQVVKNERINSPIVVQQNIAQRNTKQVKLQTSVNCPPGYKQIQGYCILPNCMIFNSITLMCMQCMPTYNLMNGKCQ